MTAHNLIADIFRRPGAWNEGLPGNVRRITGPQLDLLRRLIAEDKDAGAVQSGLGGSFTWMPRGRDKYVVTEDLRGDRHRLERLANIAAEGMGMLF